MTEDIDAVDLQRYDAICAVLYDGTHSPSNIQIIEALSDNYVSIRSEVLDYLIQVNTLDDDLAREIRKRYSSEDSEQCVGRLIMLADRLGDEPLFTGLSAELGRFEVDYMAVWSSIALAKRPNGCSIIALSYTNHPDVTLSELAKNLLLEHCFDERQLENSRKKLFGAVN